MTGLRITAVDEKTIEITGIAPVLSHCIFQLPEILRRRESPGIRDRFYQAAQPEDAKVSAE